MHWLCDRKHHRIDKGQKEDRRLEPGEPSVPDVSGAGLQLPLDPSLCLDFCFLRIPSALGFLVTALSVFWLLPTLLLKLSPIIAHSNH